MQNIIYDGWILRFADGVTRRANSVNIFNNSIINLDEKINYCEQIYYYKAIPSRFKITPVVLPANLDRALELKGYVVETITSFQTLHLSNQNFLIPNKLEFNQEISDNWIEENILLNEYTLDIFSTVKDILQNIVIPKCFVTIKENNAIGQGYGRVYWSVRGIYYGYAHPIRYVRHSTICYLS